MKIKHVNLDTVVGPTTKDLPANSLPEVAFAGKSNVGKSSLINTVLGRKSYARTSSQPGKTATINFYNLNDEIYLVDLPGYGYAKTSKEESAKWGRMIERYLYESDSLYCIFLLIDIRHTPGENDIRMYEWINYMGYQPIIIATKADKLKRSQLNKHISDIRKSLNCDEDTIIVPFSSVSKMGLDEIYDMMEQVIENYEES